MKFEYLGICGMILLSACNGKSKISGASNPIEPEIIATIQLGDEIFNDVLVDAYLHSVNDVLRAPALEYFSQALDFYRNQKKAGIAEKAFKASIQTYPTGNAYYQYGCLLLDEKRPEDALRSFEMAEHVGFEDIAYLLFQEACCKAQLNEEYSTEQLLEVAITAGLSDYNQIKENPSLANFRSTESYLTFAETFLPDSLDAENLRWSQFRNGFNNTALPLQIKYVDTWTVNEGQKSISYSFEKFVTEMRNASRFSREVGSEYIYNYRINHDDFTLLVYTVFNYASNPEIINQYLVAYGPNGNIIDKRVICGIEAEPMHIVECTLKNSDVFVLHYYEVEKTEDSFKKGKKVYSETFNIGNDGRFNSQSRKSI